MYEIKNLYNIYRPDLKIYSPSKEHTIIVDRSRAMWAGPKLLVVVTVLTLLAYIPQYNAKESLIDSVTGRALKAKSSDRAMTEGGTFVPSWIGRFDTRYGLSYFTPSYVKNSCAPNRQQCSLIPGQSYPYEQYPTDPTSTSGQPVMQVSYPAGSWSPGSEKPGGVLFYTYPTKTNPSEKTFPFSQDGATLEYEVYFPLEFEWVKGGKLPGFMGGDSNGIGCGGGNRDEDCFSYRIMWRRDGFGEAYVYLPFSAQDAFLCSDVPSCDVKQTSLACNHCTGSSGWSIGRASFQFQRGTWNRLKLQMKLNTPGFPDGLLKLTVNDLTVIEKNNVVWRTNPSVSIEGINIASWYGGSSSSWAPILDQRLYMKNFRLYYDGPYEPMVRNVGKEGPQTVVRMEIDEAD
jgi:hypothetical protein